MFADLPKPLQEKVLEYLQENNFPAAKMLYDEYHRQRVQQQLKPSLNNTKQPHADTTS
jgi:hypothetical protein